MKLVNRTQLFDELSEVSDLQESMLASFALRREPAELMFPPQFNLSEFRDWIGKDQLALVTLATGSGYHLFFVNSGRVEYIGLGRERDVQRSLANLLKKLGLMGPRSMSTNCRTKNGKMRQPKSRNRLFGNTPDDAWEKIRELVIVPDGVLWYMPFELLQIGDGGSPKKSFRHSWTFAIRQLCFWLTTPSDRNRQLNRTAVVVGKNGCRVSTMK